MAGKFINTKRVDFITDLVDGFKRRIVNGYYMHIDSKVMLCTYYNINREHSTLDEGLQIAYADLGPNSPLRFNQINNFFLYGLDKITTELENGDYGFQSSEITGDGIILPNTIIPIPGDYFKMNHLNRTYLFRVLSVTTDTLDSGANFFRISYQYHSDNDSSLLPLLIDNYETIVNNIGTELKSIIRRNDYNQIVDIEEITSNLKKYYKHLFYNERVQTFTYVYNSAFIYDPFLVEFLIRNKILELNNEYVYITQQMDLYKTFAIDYNDTIFKKIEKIDKEGLDKIYTTAELEMIKQPISILSSRQEKYWWTKYSSKSNSTNIDIIDTNLLSLIESNTNLDFDIIYTIIIKYFNSIEITMEDIDKLTDIKYDKSSKLFYYLPIVIYILEHNIKNLLFKEEI